MSGRAIIASSTGAKAADGATLCWGVALAVVSNSEPASSFSDLRGHFERSGNALPSGHDIQGAGMAKRSHQTTSTSKMEENDSSLVGREALIQHPTGKISVGVLKAAFSGVNLSQGEKKTIKAKQELESEATAPRVYYIKPQELSNAEKLMAAVERETTELADSEELIRKLSEWCSTYPSTEASKQEMSAKAMKQAMLSSQTISEVARDILKARGIELDIPAQRHGLSEENELYVRLSLIPRRVPGKAIISEMAAVIDHFNPDGTHAELKPLSLMFGPFSTKSAISEEKLNLIQLNEHCFKIFCLEGEPAAPLCNSMSQLAGSILYLRHVDPHKPFASGNANAENELLARIALIPKCYESEDVERVMKAAIAAGLSVYSRSKLEPLESLRKRYTEKNTVI
eukprot:Blabericola_migrator_1__7743@NODE_3957_length_1409_cov_14_295082_g2445_i0_p1_GENE_NODE_3957_length_1409_cov_14_295082_g2445_i0NODE_3957_length_1409_cov_14_295082_g2445_i0_p1_ORF_typecomplete_len400_score69_81_NODE_3957_length_1409_cov_14_295082_g2445_i01101309